MGRAGGLTLGGAMGLTLGILGGTTSTMELQMGTCEQLPWLSQIHS